MCISAAALALFLNLLATDDIATSPGRIIVHAEVADAHWVAVGDTWCTMAPQLDAMTRITQVGTR